jgi:hypothetical protein
MSHIGGLAMVETGRASGVMRWHVLSLESMPRAQRSLEREEVETWAPLCQTLRRHRPRGAKHDVVEWHPRVPRFPVPGHRAGDAFGALG